MVSNIPERDQAQKWFRIVADGGKHRGMARHRHPVPSMYRMASNTSRRSVPRGRPRGEGGGGSGSINCRSRSVRSIAIPGRSSMLLPGGLVPGHAGIPLFVQKQTGTCHVFPPGANPLAFRSGSELDFARLCRVAQRFNHAPDPLRRHFEPAVSGCCLAPGMIDRIGRPGFVPLPVWRGALE